MTRVILLSLLVTIAAAPAFAEIECSGEMADWQPVAKLMSVARDMGWTVTKVRADDGCYHIRATDKAGHKVKAVFDPETLKLLGREGEDVEDHGDHDAPAKGSSNAGSSN